METHTHTLGKRFLGPSLGRRPFYKVAVFVASNSSNSCRSAAQLGIQASSYISRPLVYHFFTVLVISASAVASWSFGSSIPVFRVAASSVWCDGFEFITSHHSDGPHLIDGFSQDRLLTCYWEGILSSSTCIAKFHPFVFLAWPLPVVFLLPIACNCVKHTEEAVRPLGGML